MTVILSSGLALVDCNKIDRCADGCCMTCYHCIGRRWENMIALFGDDALGAMCKLSGHDTQCSTLICTRGQEVTR